MLLVACGRVGFEPQADADVRPSVFGTRGGPGADSIADLAIDAAGNITVIGTVRSALQLGDTQLTHHGDADVVVVHADAEGRLVWARQFGTTGLDAGHSLAIDETGSIYIIGLTTGPLDLGGGNLAVQDEDMFLAKLTSDGQHVWSRRYGAMATPTPYGTDDGNAIAYSAGLLVAGGTCKGGVDFGSGPICGQATATDGNDAFLATFGVDAGPRWSRAISGLRFNEVFDTAADANRVYATGYYEGTPDLGGGPATAYRGIQDGFVVAIDRANGFAWSADFGGADFDWAYGIAPDAAGNVYVVGYFGSATAMFGATTFTLGGNGDGFIASFDPAGNYRWVKQIGGAGCDYLRNVTVLSTGEIVAVGAFSGTVDFGQGPVTADAQDALAIAFDASGELLWTRTMSSAGDDQIRVLAEASDGSLIAAGFTGATMTACNSNSTTTEGDLFIGKL